MLVSSWSVRGVPVLAELATPEQYANEARFTGLPLMYPWANRLGGHRLPTPDGPWPLPVDPRVLTTDPAGLPLHGAHPSLLRFSTDTPASRDPSSVDHRDRTSATLHWGRTEEQRALFPFEHRVQVAIGIGPSSLHISVTVHADAMAVPVSFGVHPYLRLDSDPADWRVELPARTPVVLDERLVPTGEHSERRGPEVIAVRTRALDDGFVGLDGGVGLRLFDTSRSITVTHERGYPCAQIYAPSDADVVCLEPMTAPTDALRRGTSSVVEPGGSFTAVCELRVDDRA